MLLKYRGIPYSASSQSAQRYGNGSKDIALTYRGVSYLIGKSTSDRASNLPSHIQPEMFLAYRGVFYYHA